MGLDVSIIILSVFFGMTSICCLIISLILINIHLRQAILMQGYFNVVFGMIMIEMLMNVMIIINSIFNVIDPFYSINVLIPKIIGFCNTFLFSMHISYNLITIFYLCRKSKLREPLIDNEITSQRDRKESFDSVRLNKQSFCHIHIPCIIVGMIHCLTIFFVGYSGIYYVPLGLHDNTNIDDTLVFIVFLLNYLFFLISIIYCSLSFNQLKISDMIRLKQYGLYCLITALIWLVFPLYYLVRLLTKDNTSHLYTIFSYVFMLMMIVNSSFHLNSYYVNYILSSKEKGLGGKISMAFKLLFFIETVPELNFIDVNSAFIYHSLSSQSDLIVEASSVSISPDNI